MKKWWHTGRTIPSFRIAAGQEIAVWRPFKGALPKGERVLFDGMMNLVRLYVSASSTAVRASKFEGLIVSILFHHYKELQMISEEMHLIEEKLREKDELR